MELMLITLKVRPQDSYIVASDGLGVVAASINTCVHYRDLSGAAIMHGAVDPAIAYDEMSACEVQSASNDLGVDNDSFFVDRTSLIVGRKHDSPGHARVLVPRPATSPGIGSTRSIASADAMRIQRFSC